MAAVRLTERVLWSPPDDRTDRPALLHLRGSEGSVLLDVGASPRHLRGFLDDAQVQGSTPLTWAVLTHWHWDHTFGGSAAGVPIAAQRGTVAQLERLRALAWDDASLDERVRRGEEVPFIRDMLTLELPDRSSLRIVVPQVAFGDGLTLRLGDRACDAVHVGGDHAADSTIMWLPQERLLFLGDALYERIDVPQPYYTDAGLRGVLARLRRYDPEIVVDGHRDEPMDADAFRRHLAMFDDALEIAPTSREVSDPDLAEVVRLLRSGAGRRHR